MMKKNTINENIEGIKRCFQELDQLFEESHELINEYEKNTSSYEKLYEEVKEV